MEIPLDPLPERGLCEYEKIREDIIRERKEFMANCGFFDSLDTEKHEMGLIGNVKTMKHEMKEARSNGTTRKKTNNVNMTDMKHWRDEKVNEVKTIGAAEEKVQELEKQISEKLENQSEKPEEKTFVSNINQVYNNKFMQDEWNYFDLFDLM